MKKIISLVLVVTMVIAFLNPVFASQNYNDNMVGDTANNDIKCRMSDLFYSYPSLLLYSTGLQEHSANLAMIEANVTNEYVTTPAFYISSILYGTSIATNKKELTKYIFDKVGITNFAEEKYMDDANTKLLTYGHMFEASEIYKFDQMSGYYLTTADLVKNELSEIAKHNSTYNKKYIEDKYKNLSFQQMIEKGINFISSHDVSKFERENNNEEYTVISDELYLLEASDDIKENAIYTTNNVIKSSLRATGKKIIIPNGENIIIDGNLDINNSSLEINGSLTVTGNMIINGSNIEIPMIIYIIKSYIMRLNGV